MEIYYNCFVEFFDFEEMKKYNLEYKLVTTSSLKSTARKPPLIDEIKKFNKDKSEEKKMIIHSGLLYSTSNKLASFAPFYIHSAIDISSKTKNLLVLISGENPNFNKYLCEVFHMLSIKFGIIHLDMKFLTIENFNLKDAENVNKSFILSKSFERSLFSDFHITPIKSIFYGIPFGTDVLKIKFTNVIEVINAIIEKKTFNTV